MHVLFRNIDPFQIINKMRISLTGLNSLKYIQKHRHELEKKKTSRFFPPMYQQAKTFPCLFIKTIMMIIFHLAFI